MPTLDSKMLIIDYDAPQNCLFIAPKEFIALVANYIRAIDEKNKATIDQAKLLLDAWLIKDNNAKSLSLLKNVGEDNA